MQLWCLEMGLSCNSFGMGMDFLHSFMSGLPQPENCLHIKHEWGNLLMGLAQQHIIRALGMRWKTMIVPIIKWWIWQFFADAFKPELHCDGASKFLVYWHCIWLKVTAKKSWLIAWTTDTQRGLIFKNLKLLGLDRQIGLKSWDI